MVLGSANGDQYYFVNHVPRVGETLDASKTSQACGGKGANQAAAASRLGAYTTFLGQVGNDEMGRMITSALKGAGVRTEKMHVLKDTASGHALIISQADGNNSIIIVGAAN